MGRCKNANVKAQRRLVVPVNGSPSDQDALELACIVARRQRARVEAVFVIQVRRSLPLDADMSAEIERGEAVLDRAEQAAAKLEVEIETSLLQARDIGAAIVDEAAQAQADTIVLGLPYRKRFGEFEVGETAIYVMKNAPCRVWIVRAPMDEP
jgi:nucleotide-binding universal stress UspA family protein